MKGIPTQIVLTPDLSAHLWQKGEANIRTSEESLGLSFTFIPVFEVPACLFTSIRGPTRCFASTSRCASFVLLLLLWCVVFATLRIDHPALSTLSLAFSSVTFVASLSLVDRTLLRILLRQFEYWYLAFFYFLFIGTSLVGLAGKFSTFFALGYLVPIFLLVGLSLLLDCLPTVSHSWRTTLRVTSDLVLCHVLILDLFFEPLFMEYDICIFYCTDTRRLASSCTTQLLFFLLRDTVSGCLQLGMSHQRLNRIKLALDITLESDASKPSFEPRGRRTSVVSTDDKVVISCPFSWGSFGEPVENGDLDNSNVIVRHWKFSAIGPSQFAPVSNSFWWKLMFVLIALADNLLVVLEAGMYSQPGYSARELSILVVAFLIGWVESCRFDGFLLSCVARRFEFWYFVFLLAQLAIFSSISQLNRMADDMEKVTNSFDFLVNVLFFCIVYAIDIAPSFSRRLRKILVSIVFLNMVRVPVQYYFNRHTYESVPVCFLHCADSASLSMSVYSSLALFSFKYVVTDFRYPSRATLLKAYVLCSVRPLPESHDVEISLSSLEIPDPIMTADHIPSSTNSTPNDSVWTIVSPTNEASRSYFRHERAS